MNSDGPSFPPTEPDGNGRNYPRIVAIITLFLFTSLVIAAILVPNGKKSGNPSNVSTVASSASTAEAQVKELEKTDPQYAAAVQQTQQFNQQYRTVWVKDGVDLATAVAQAQANGAKVVGQLSALGAYTVTADTVDETKDLSSTQISDTTMPLPNYTSVLPPPGGGSGVPTYSSSPSISPSSNLVSGNLVGINHASWNGNGAAITAYAYTWYRCSNTSTGSCVSNGTSSGSYTLGSADVGKYIAVAEAACNSYGCGAYDESGVYGPVQSPTPPGGSGGSNPCNSEKISYSLVRVNARLSKTDSGDCQGSVPIGIAVIDSGVNKVPDLNVVSQMSFYGATPANGCQATDKNATDVYGHGTAVAGVIGAIDNNAGSVGTAPGANIYSLRTQDSNGNGQWAYVICAINYLATNKNISVANMSINGITSYSSTDVCYSNGEQDALHLAICRAEAASGVVFVASAGNGGNNTTFDNTAPSTYPEVLSVTAINDYNGVPGGGARPSCTSNNPNLVLGADDAFATYSDVPSAIDMPHTVAAPGSCVYTTEKDGSYGDWLGTSFSAPIVAGAVADCRYDGICTGTPAQIIAKIHSDAVAYNAAHPTYGYTGPQGGPLISLSLY